MRGVTITGSPNMKFIADGRSACLQGPRHWNLRKHGFEFFQHKTSLPLSTFHSPTSNKQPQQLFKFSGSSAVAVAADAQSSSWTSDYNLEIAEACKRVLPSAEAAFVAYHVLRKSDVSFSTGKHAVAPKDADSEAHRIAARMVSSLDTLDFVPVLEQERLLRLLSGDDNGPKQFTRMMCQPVASELREEVVEVLHEDGYYAYVGKAREVLEALAYKRRQLLVPPKDPSSIAHQVVSQLLANYQYIDMYPKSYKRAAGAMLHLEGREGVESFLAEVVSGQSLPKSENPHSLMPDATPELQKAVLDLLHNDTEYYNFVETSRLILPKPQQHTEHNSDLDAASFQPPAIGACHTDVSAEGCLSQFRQSIPETHALGKPGLGMKRRVVLLKFWRSVADTPILNHHLAVLDKSSLNDAEIFEAEINFKGYSIKQNRLVSGIDVDKLRWVYFPQMERDEVLCFQQGDLTMHGSWDSSASSCVTFPECRQDHATFHAAFEDPTAPRNAPSRQSIEAAAFVFLPEEPDVSSKL